MLFESIMALGMFFVALIVLTFVWSFVWKGIALWRCGRNNQLGWYIAILILNTCGILEIIYLVWFQKKTDSNKA